MRIRGVAVGVALLVACLLAGCSGSTVATGGGCVPLVQIEPAVVHAGDVVSVIVEGGCHLDPPAGGWMIIAAPVGKLASAVRTSVAGDLGDGLTAELTLPADFPAGDAFAGIDDWDYSACSDTGSCASPSGNFEVVAG